MLPPAAQDLVRGVEPLGNREDGCLEMTIDDARSLAGILTDAGYESGAGATGSVFFGTEHVLVAFDPILPDGGFVDGVGG